MDSFELNGRLVFRAFHKIIEICLHFQQQHREGVSQFNTEFVRHAISSLDPSVLETGDQPPWTCSTELHITPEQSADGRCIPCSTSRIKMPDLSQHGVGLTGIQQVPSHSKSKTLIAKQGLLIGEVGEQCLGFIKPSRLLQPILLGR